MRHDPRLRVLIDARQPGVAESLADGLRGPNQVALLTVVDREQANVFTALEWMVAAGETAQATRLAAALGPYWSLRGSYAEGIGWLNGGSPSTPGRQTSRERWP